MKTCVSLFSCAGIGDLGLRACGYHTLVANELLLDRANLMQENFPETIVIQGDIRDSVDVIVETTLRLLDGKRLDLIIASPPCQGFSSNGLGRIQSEVRKGKRTSYDSRNQLIIPTVDVIARLRPRAIVLENVPNMQRGEVWTEDQPVKMFDYLHQSLSQYVLRAKILNACEYGVPQVRKRLITVGIDANLAPSSLSRDDNFASVTGHTPLHPFPTHGPAGPHAYISLNEATAHLSPLDAREKLACDDDALHRIPTFNTMQYFCMQHTPENETAFRNTGCTECNALTLDLQAAACQACAAILPRPVKRDKDGAVRLIKAFRTAYRRMAGDQPANTLTMNSGCISSDVKGHPTQIRVLSLREIMIVASICAFPTSEARGQDICWIYHFNNATDKQIRQVIGECICPLVSYRIGQNLDKLIA